MPDVSDCTVVVFAKVPVLYHVVAVPFKSRDKAEDAANPAPPIVTVLPALTAVTPSVARGITVKV